MSNSILSVNNAVSNNTNPSLQTGNNQPLTLEQLAQESAQANQGSVYGPPYILDISPANASAIAPSTASAGSSEQQSFQSDLQQLAQSLQTGNLSGAQQAFASLEQLPGVQTALQQAQSGNTSDPFAQALNQIGSALQSGNLGGAQQAFASLEQLAGQSTSQASHIPHVGGHHHHHGGGGSSQASSSSASDSTSEDSLLTDTTDSTDSSQSNP